MPEENSVLAGMNLTPTEEQKVAAYRQNIEMGSRSFISETMNIPLPKGLHGEWIGVDTFAQYNADRLGFKDGSEFVKKLGIPGIHSADGTLGDTKFMVIEQWKYEEQEKSRQELIARKHGTREELLRGRVGDGEHEKFKMGVRSEHLQVASEAPVAKAVGATEINQALRGK